MISYGPVPSRRLGRSLGINNIPAKTCTYSCVYCQLGRTTKMTVDRAIFYDPDDIFKDVRKKVKQANSKNNRIDYMTFVPDGEPTLDLNLKSEIELINNLALPLAIITNSSLLWRDDVRKCLLDVDLVSLKIDAVSENNWHKINRPHKALKLDLILEGIGHFSEMYNGIIITETMLIDGIQYNSEFERIASFLTEMGVDKAYISVPTRPPAEDWVKPAQEDVLNRAFFSFAEKIGSEKVELLMGYEGDAFSSTGNLEKDLLSITSVHPMRENAVRKLVEKANATWDIIDNLIDTGKIIELTYQGEKYFMRSLPSRDSYHHSKQNHMEM